MSGHALLAYVESRSRTDPGLVADNDAIARRVRRLRERGAPTGMLQETRRQQIKRCGGEQCRQQPRRQHQRRQRPRISPAINEIAAPSSAPPQPSNDDEEEAVAAAQFSKLLDDKTWSLSHGSEGLHARSLVDGHGGTLLVAFSSGAAHFDFEASFNALRDDDDMLRGLLVSDSDLTWFLRAPLEEEEGESSDAYSAVISMVKHEIAKRRPARLLTLGYCRGGYAAIRCGLALNASRILAFSPQCYLHPEERSSKGLPPSYYDGHLEALMKVDAPMDSLEEVLTRRAKVDAAAIEIDLHVGGDCEGDVLETSKLVSWWKESSSKECGSPSSSIKLSHHVHDRCGHELPLNLKQNGQLVPLLRGWLNGGGVELQPPPSPPPPPPPLPPCFFTLPFPPLYYIVLKHKLSNISFFYINISI